MEHQMNGPTRRKEAAGMFEISCYVRSCYFNDQDGGCEKRFGPTITEDELTAAGFLPVRKDYEEREEGSGDGKTV